MKAAIYARLSREDEEKIDGNNDSRSIENQIKTLTNYANEHHFEITNIYYDDGYSGSNLDRPGFQKMINDAKNKQFNILLIKDLSRLGRKLYQVGTLVEKTLPQMGIRLIAINDNYDAATYKDDESVVLRNFLNDYYLKEFRRKCRASLAHRAQTIHINYYPKYSVVKELDIGNYLFTRIFACKILQALASMRAQATQEKLHNISLDTDDLLSRVAELKKEIRDLNRSAISFSGMAPV